MSKASEFADKLVEAKLNGWNTDERTKDIFRPKGFDKFYVNDGGFLVIVNADGLYPPENALGFAKWLVDTFGE